MPLNNKEKIISIISNGIAVFSLLQERGELPFEIMDIIFSLLFKGMIIMK
jgi:hypothetical protein